MCDIKNEEKHLNARPNNKFSRCPDTPSECNLVIDDDYEDNVQKVKIKRTKGVRNSAEPIHIICSWEECGKLFHEFTGYVDHVEEHAFETDTVGEDLYICGFEPCEYYTKSNQSFTRHVMFHCHHERLKNIGINVVERQALPKCNSLDQYEIGEVPTYECKWNRCKDMFNTVNAFFNHVREHSNSTKQGYCKKGDFIKCEWLGCYLKFTSQYKLIDHLRSHTTEKMIACPTCGNMYASKTRFADHRKRQIPIELQSFQCSECSKLFSTERLLRDHMRSHINHYKCNMCDMTCSRPSMLALHVRFRHMSERPFKCSFCRFAAVTKHNLEQHLTTHCSELIYACEYCEFRCRSMEGLEGHLQKEHVQDISPLYECHCCQQRFTRGPKLTKHLIKKHDFYWPSGHSRFRYKQHADGFYRLQTVRYESLEVTQEMMTDLSPVVDDSKYAVTINQGAPGRIPSFVLSLTKQTEDEDLPEEVSSHAIGRDVVLDINDVDIAGNVINHEMVLSKEIIQNIKLEGR